jgi:hypothetical protein
MEAKNRVGIGLSYRPTRLHRQAELIPMESIPGLLNSLKIRALAEITVVKLLVHLCPHIIGALGRGLAKSSSTFQILIFPLIQYIYYIQRKSFMN